MPKVRRRDFLKLVGAGGVGVGAGILFGQSKERAAQFLIPQPVMPEAYSPGIASWYNTVCRQCPAGCGISVRTREGRAKKIEGNALHPVSQGKTCSLGQAGLNVLYHPDRLTAPLERDGGRGAGSFTGLAWEDAYRRIAGRIDELRGEGRGDRVYLLSGGVRGHLDHLFENFMTSIGSPNYFHWALDHPASLYAANRRCFNIERLPYYDIGNTDFLLSFGADPLDAWVSPVHYSMGYGQMRQGRPGQRGHFVQIEGHMSLSGANADQWLPARPGSEGLIALAMAAHLIGEGVYDGDDAGQWRSALAGFTAARAAEASGLDEPVIRQLATDFAAAPNKLAIGGGAAANTTRGVGNLVAINVLNYLAGSIGQSGGILFNPPPAFGADTHHRFASYERMRQLAEDARAGQIEILIVNDANPVFNLPDAAGFAEALDHIPMVVALSNFMDETTALADIILPTHSALESWGDDVPEPGVGFPVATLSQPAVQALYDSRQAGDIVLGLARHLELDFPWSDTREFIRESWRQIFEARADQIELMSFDEFWEATLVSGVWGLSDVQADQAAPRLSPGVLDEFEFAAEPSAPGGDNGYVLQPFMKQSWHDGRGTGLPWMQELHDPVTGIAYGSWVDLNPQTAADLGVKEGDVVEISSGSGSLTAPVFVMPGTRPDVVAIAFGQGHTDHGRYARDRGVNPLTIVDPAVDPASGALAWASTRVSLRKTGERVRLIKKSGVPRQLSRNILGDKTKTAPENDS